MKLYDIYVKFLIVKFCIICRKYFGLRILYNCNFLFVEFFFFSVIIFYFEFYVENKDEKGSKKVCYFFINNFFFKIYK